MERRASIRLTLLVSFVFLLVVAIFPLQLVVGRFNIVVVIVVTFLLFPFGVVVRFRVLVVGKVHRLAVG